MRGWLLDTNVVSELARPRPEDRVLEWLAAQPQERLFISVLTLAELDQGVAFMPPDDQRRPLVERFRNRIEIEFAGRILSLDDVAARHWGVLSGQYRRATGGRLPLIDTMLAATALHRSLYLVTRNTRDVSGSGAATFNPWTDGVSGFPIDD